jgi:1-acyl-sn-glycerol-3-phosphate acyltransferase
MKDGLAGWLARAGARLYASVLLETDVQSLGPMPEGAKIIAVNHPTTTDPFWLMGLLCEPLHIMITEMCFHVPLLGRFLRRAGHVAVVDGQGRTALDEGIRLLEAGHTIGVFPEGALSPLEGGTCPPHTGVARFALATGAPVLPVGIHLRREYVHLRRTTVRGKTEVARFYFHGPYVVTIGEPMRFEGAVEDREYVRTVAQRIMQRIDQLAQQSAYRLHSAIPASRSGSGFTPWLNRASPRATAASGTP